MMKRITFVVLNLIAFALQPVFGQQTSINKLSGDVSKWAPEVNSDDFFNGRMVSGLDALNYWMQSYNWRSNPGNKIEKKSKIELLLSGDDTQVALGNNEIQVECKQLLANPAVWKKKYQGSRLPMIWIEVALRAGDKLSSETKAILDSALRTLNVDEAGAGYINWINTPASNGANVHGYVTPLTLTSAVINDKHGLTHGKNALYSELRYMSLSGDEAEYNLLESHWAGAESWNIIKQYVPDANLRRVARLISERLWIDKFLTWSQNIQRNTGPGSRMAPSEWLGSDTERALFATGLSKPIWLNFFFKWDNWDAKNYHQTYENTPTEAILPDLPSYLQDLAWRKSFPNLLQTSTLYKTWSPFPLLPGVPIGNLGSPKKYINYQAENYTIGSSTSSWVSNSSNVVASAWWNNNKSTDKPLGSPERFDVLYPHYVFNGMSTLDKDQGNIYFDSNPAKPLSDDKGGAGGPWLREFADYGRAGTIQDRNTMIISYSGRPGTPHEGQTLVKSKTLRASAGLFLFRWNNSTDGLFINRKPVQNLPVQLNPGDWWFVHDGDTYAAVLPLKATALKGSCKIMLEKRNRHIVLYQDNVNANDIQGISDEDWVKARSGFVIEMGNAKEYGSFSNFQNQVMAGKVTVDEANGFERHIAYERADRKLEMRWNCYTEEYPLRKIGGQNDPWIRFAKSPEFNVSDAGSLQVKDATLKTSAGNTVWLLSSTPSYNWVAYQANPDKFLPIDFTSPICKLTTSAFPLGKIVVHKVSANTISIDIDADYEQGQNISPLQVKASNYITKVILAINGVSYEPKFIKRTGKNVYTINPTDKLIQISNR